jgi:hypothetical protein
MLPPDWERADQFRSQADEPGADRGLAQRLSRLPSSHPSAWPAPDYSGAEYRERDREEWWRPADDAGSPDAEPDDTEWAGTEPDDADLAPEDSADEPEAVPPGDDADLEDTPGAPGDASRRAAPARGGRRPETSTGWGELGGPTARSPYRPWFSAEGAADPWFAVRDTE